MTTIHDEMPDGTDDDSSAEDRPNAPFSGRETERLQEDQSTSSDADTEDVTLLPGTGGPDDSGTVEIDPDVKLPFDTRP